MPTTTVVFSFERATELQATMVAQAAIIIGVETTNMPNVIDKKLENGIVTVVRYWPTIEQAEEWITFSNSFDPISAVLDPTGSIPNTLLGSV